MKRILIIFTSVLLTLCGCYAPKDEKTEKDYIKGVWFSYAELDNMLSRDFKSEFSKAITSCKDLGITDVFIHTIPFCDAIYRSEYYPLRKTAQDKDFDVLAYITDTAHSAGMRVHAWINPYRVRTADSDITALPDGSPAGLWAAEKNQTAVCFSDGIYLNPTSDKVTRLILNGIGELTEKYDIDGIHFDDYFYPTEDEEFDKDSYKVYSQENSNPLSLYDWRRANINALISSVKREVKSAGEDKIFSISPAASVENNYEKLCADVEHWLENGYADWIIPQLYFGFSYPEPQFRFDSLLAEWKGLAYGTDTRLIIGLASYKIGTDTEYEAEEWASGNVLKRQVTLCEAEADGYCFFSYSSLFGQSELQSEERGNLE